MRALLLGLLIVLWSGVEIRAQNGDSAQVSPVKETEIYDVTGVEELPEFPGGEKGRLKYFKENLRYPKEARSKGIKGRVYIEFKITKQGEVAEVHVKRGVDPLLDAEAVRVVGAMPNWSPGILGGKPVTVLLVQPVDFSLW
jgi:TonB family protein